MPAVDVVAAVGVLSVDGESEAGNELEHPLADYRDAGDVGFRRTVVGAAGHRQHCHVHCDRTHQVQYRQH